MLPQKPLSYPEGRLLIFAKAPIPGQVKTRLLPVLTKQQAAWLQALLIRRTVKLAATSALAPIQLWCSPSVDHPFFSRCQENFPIALHTQTGGHLGERMQNAIGQVLEQTSFARPIPAGQPASVQKRSRQTGAVIIGCDCPALTEVDLREAFSILQKGYDAVLGPASDGGYVLLGLRRPCPALFKNMPWGTDQVLAETRERLQQQGLNWRELTERWDLDRPEDLARLNSAILAESLQEREELNRLIGAGVGSGLS